MSSSTQRQQPRSTSARAPVQPRAPEHARGAPPPRPQSGRPPLLQPAQARRVLGTTPTRAPRAAARECATGALAERRRIPARSCRGRPCGSLRSNVGTPSGPRSRGPANAESSSIQSEKAVDDGVAVDKGARTSVGADAWGGAASEVAASTWLGTGSLEAVTAEGLGAAGAIGAGVVEAGNVAAGAVTTCDAAWPAPARGGRGTRTSGSRGGYGLP